MAHVGNGAAAEEEVGAGDRISTDMFTVRDVTVICDDVPTLISYTYITWATSTRLLRVF